MCLLVNIGICSRIGLVVTEYDDPLGMVLMIYDKKVGNVDKMEEMMYSLIK